VSEIKITAAIQPADHPRVTLRILLVEDNLVNQRLTARLLEKMGHVVTIAEDGHIALQILPEQEFDLVAMHMQMPIMDGLETTEKIRASEKNNRQAPAHRGHDRECVRRGPPALPERRNGWLYRQTRQLPPLNGRSSA
jgi:CheY-like chemotaxis protein